MADKKISALTAATTPLAGTEVLPIVQGGATVNVAVSNLTAGRAVSAASLALTTTPLPATSGGTGQSSYAVGDLLYASTTTALSKLADVATGNALISGGVSTAPSWGKIGLTTHVSGTLPVTNGGTGTATAFTSGSVVFAGASGVYSQANSGLFYNSTNVSLGIGTASPAGALDARGIAAVITAQQNAAGSAAYYIMDTTVESGGKRWRFGYSGATGFTNFSFYNQTDNVTALNLASDGIVTMSAYGAGAATFSAAGVISSVSDETWKIKDGIPENPDEMLKKLEPGYWYYNDEKKEVFGAERQLGFYAQNVNSAIGPEAAPTPTEITMPDDTGTQVGTGQFRPWGYYDRSVLAVTVMSLKKALAAIETLEAKVAALEAKTI